MGQRNLFHVIWPNCLVWINFWLLYVGYVWDWSTAPLFVVSLVKFKKTWIYQSKILLQFLSVANFDKLMIQQPVIISQTGYDSDFWKNDKILEKHIPWKKT